jgi:kynurenine formamidase
MPSVDQIPLERLLADGILIDVSQQAAQNRDFQVGPEDLIGWEKQSGRIPDGSILLLRTGWGAYYPDREKYLGTAERGPAAIADLHFPGLSPSAARWLVANRNVAAVGIDTASIDYGQSELFESHQILFKASIPVLENVANLQLLPPKGFEVIALPMKIEGGSGAPLRIIALRR